MHRSVNWLGLAAAAMRDCKYFDADEQSAEYSRNDYVEEYIDLALALRPGSSTAATR